jgi:UDPglucose--hexose-1-phosphate uridylyltransferase
MNGDTPAFDTTHEPQFRFDPLTRQWVAITETRQSRPNLPGAGSCPFCVGGQEAGEPYDVKSFPNRWPALVPGELINLHEYADVDDVSIPARGATEVVLYSPDHEGSFATLDRAQARRVVDLWAERTAALLDRPEVKYVLVFENNGAEVGATIAHPHGQIYAFPFVPPVPEHEAQVAAEHGCPICSELLDRHDLRGRTVDANRTFVAFARRAAAWPFELLIVPRQHTPALELLEAGERDDFADVLRSALSRYRYLFDEPLPYMLWIHPGVHLHVHVVSTRRDSTAVRYVAAGELGSGVMFNPVSPEQAAIALRQVDLRARVPEKDGPAIGSSQPVRLGEDRRRRTSPPP